MFRLRYLVMPISLFSQTLNVPIVFTKDCPFLQVLKWVDYYRGLRIRLSILMNKFQYFFQLLRFILYFIVFTVYLFKEAFFKILVVYKNKFPVNLCCISAITDHQIGIITVFSFIILIQLKFIIHFNKFRMAMK